jgi:tRNA threonylcarbamoyladenosine biosynthesis protein TsaE
MTEPLEIELDALDATRRVGMALGRALPRRAVCLFFGEMAAGKTTLIKAVCEGLGIAPENVISPTYTLVNIYPAARRVYHVDLFRIEQPEALLEMDRGDWVNPDGPTLIEWPEAALPLLAGEAPLSLRLEAPPGDPGRRTLRLEGDREIYGEVFQALAALGGTGRGFHLDFAEER